MQEQNGLAKSPGPSQEQVIEYQSAIERQLQVVEIQTDQGPVKLTPAIVRRYLAVGDSSKFTDQDLTLFMAMCKFHQLNPFIREVWPIKFGANLSIVVAKDTFIKRAGEDPNVEWWKAGIIVWNSDEKRYWDTQGIIPPGAELIGAWAEAQEKDKPFTTRLEVNLEEYDLKQSLWKDKKATMLRKVAIVQLLREITGKKTRKLYIPDELGLDPDMMPEGALDMDKIRAETGERPKNTNEKTEPAEETPSGNFPRRSRRNKFTGLDKELFPQGKIETCGIKPEQLKALGLYAADPANVSVMDQFLQARIGYGELSYLREDEAVELIAMMKPVDSGTGEETFDPPESAFNKPPVDDPVPVQGLSQSTSEPEKVMCPQSGEVTMKSWCLQQCKLRAADKFCIALGEKPPRSGLFGGGA